MQGASTVRTPASIAIRKKIILVDFCDEIGETRAAAPLLDKVAILVDLD
jgi:hypothetical protein